MEKSYFYGYSEEKLEQYKEIIEFTEEQNGYISYKPKPQSLGNVKDASLLYMAIVNYNYIKWSKEHFRKTVVDILDNDIITTLASIMYNLVEIHNMPVSMIVDIYTYI